MTADGGALRVEVPGRALEVVAAGPADDVLTEQALSETFGLSLSLSRTDGRFTARRAA